MKKQRKKILKVCRIQQHLAVRWQISCDCNKSQPSDIISMLLLCFIKKKILRGKFLKWKIVQLKKSSVKLNHFHVVLRNWSFLGTKT